SKSLGPNYHLLTFVTPEDFEFEAGQYVRMIFSDRDGEFERYYSIANAPNPDRHLQFCVQKTDPRVAPVLPHLKVGGTQLITEPGGRFRLIDDHRPVVLVAGGSGISPMRSFFFKITHAMTAAPDRPL